MKKMIALALSYSFIFSSMAFGQPVAHVDQIIRDYKIDVRVNGANPDTAMENLTQELLDEGVTKQDLINYIKENSSAEDFAIFMSVVENGQTEIANMGELESQEFEYILSQAFTNSNVQTGANYAGCGAVVGLGVTLIVAGVVLGIMALDANGNIDRDSSDGIDVDVDYNNRNEDRARDLGIAAAITGTVGIVLTAGGC